MKKSDWKIAIVCLAFQAIAVNMLVLDYTQDDAFISFRYAQNLVDHGTLYYNIGESGPHGFSNPLWVLLLAGIYWVTEGLVGIEWIARLLATVLLGDMTLPVIHSVRQRFESRGPASDLAQGVSVSLLTLAFPYLLPGFMSGLETPLFTLAVLVLLTTSLRGQSFGWKESVATTIAMTVRIDGLVLVGPLLAVRWYQSWRNEELRRALLWSTSAAALGITVHFVAFGIAGSFVPLSFLHKGEGFSLGLMFHYLKIDALLLIPSLLLASKHLSRRRFTGLVLYLAYASFIYSFFSHWHFERYVFPFIFSAFVVTLEPALRRLKALPVEVSILLCLYCGLALTPATLFGYDWVSGYRVAKHEIKELALAMRDSKVPEEDRLVMAPDAGLLMYYSGWRILDSNGLTTAEIYGSSLTELIEEKRPALILITDWSGIPREKLKLRHPISGEMESIPEEYQLVAFAPLTHRYYKPNTQYNYYILARKGVDEGLLREIEAIDFESQPSIGVQAFPRRLLRSLADPFHW